MKTSKRISKPEIPTEDFDKDIEEARTLRDVERLEKKDSHLWLLAVFMIVAVTLLILIRDLAALKLSPPEIWEGIASFQPSALIFPAAPLLLAFAAYLLKKSGNLRRMRREVFVQKTKLEREAGSMEEMVALFQISSAIDTHKEFPTILEMIGRESLNCLKAHRSTVYLMEEKSGILKTQFTFSSDALYEQVGLFEEKELARKALRQRKPFFLRDPADFSEFLKHKERDRKITSLLSIPLVFQDKAFGALTTVIIDDDRGFAERDLRFLQVLGNHVSIAMENSSLGEEVRKGVGFRKNYEQYLDHILNQLQALSDVERSRIEDHIGRLLPASAAAVNLPLSEQTEEVVKGTLPMLEPAGVGRAGDDRVTKMLRVDLEGEPLAIAQDLGEGGIFIRTPNPLDLGEEFVLKLHLAEGQAPIEAACKVIWTNKYGKESQHLRRGMGVKFLNLSPELQTRVEAYVQSHKNQQFSFAEDPHHLSLKD